MQGCPEYPVLLEKKDGFEYQNEYFSLVRLKEEMKKMLFKIIFPYLVPEISVFKGPNFDLFLHFLNDVKHSVSTF